MSDRIYESLQRKGLSPQFEKPGIYSITIDGILAYIGKSKNILERMAFHYANMQKPKGHKYKVLAEAAKTKHKIRFSVLY